jgi:hypothetical protein
LRFQYRIETCWKAARSFLDEHESLNVASPGSAIRYSREVGLLSDIEAAAALEMVKDRDLTAHTCNEPLANALYERLPGHHGLLERWVAEMTRRLGT